MDFNEKQLKVINEIEKNIYLTAPAGTGKTMVLSERVKKLLDSGVDGKEILCITFTNKACTELKDRVMLRTEGKGKNITVKTFHSFCLSIIKENAKRKTDIFFDFSVFDVDDCKDIVKRMCISKDSMGNLVTLDNGRLYKCIELIKSTRIAKDIFSENEKADFKKVIEIIKTNKDLYEKLQDCTKYKADRFEFKEDYVLRDIILSRGEELVRIYNSILINNRALDFNDLLSMAREIFKDETIVESYRKRYKYISIDEMQDTGLIEYSVVKKLFHGNNVLLCGDYFQTIYSFRGSRPKEILEDFESFNPVKISFDENYRSTETINEISTNFLKNLFKKEYDEIYKEGLKSYSHEKGKKLDVIENMNFMEESKAIVKKCIDIEKKGENLKSTCILTRNNFLAKDLSENIQRMNLDLSFNFSLVDQFQFFKRVEIKDMVAFLKVIISENDTMNLERILKKLNTNISEDLLKEIGDVRHRKLRVKLNDYLSSYTEFGDYYSVLIDGLDNSEIVVFDVESTGIDVTEDEIIQIAAIRLDSKGREIEKFERFIKPSKSVGSSVLVHGFSDKLLSEIGEEKSIVFKDFLKFIEGKVLVGHNVNYDISIFSSELSRINMGSILAKGVYDTLEIYRRFNSNLPNHKLEFLSEYFKTKTKPSHNALDDIRATGEILVMAVNSRIRSELDKRKALIGENYRKFNKFRLKLEKIREESYNLRSYEMVDYLLKEFNFFGKYPEEEKPKKKENIEKFKEVLKILDDKEKSPRDSIIDCVNITALSNGEIEEVMVSKTGEIKVPIITVHQAKGLEYENVIICGLEEGLFPYKKAEYREEGRVFYVAVTRAKKTLTLTYSLKNTWGKPVFKSTFIDLLEK